MNRSRAHTRLVSAIVKDLNQIPEVRAVKQHQSRYGIVGTPDVLVVAQGRVAFLEAKTGNAELRPAQAVQMALWKLAGALCATVRSVEEARDLVLGLLYRKTT